MIYKVISLARTPDRLARFAAINSNLEHSVFSAVDGKDVNRISLLANNIITQNIADRYTDGAIGAALSHRTLWEQCVELDQPITILEDDAYLNVNFSSIVESACRSPDWDFIFWGSNLDNNIEMEFIPGIAYASVKVDYASAVNNIEGFVTQEFPVVLNRCRFMIGLVAYSITPQCAKYLLSSCFPLRDYDKPYLNFGVDHAVLEELPNIRAFCATPPLAMTRNDHKESTIQK